VFCSVADDFEDADDDDMGDEMEQPEDEAHIELLQPGERDKAQLMAERITTPYMTNQIRKSSGVGDEGPSDRHVRPRHGRTGRRDGSSANRHEGIETKEDSYCYSALPPRRKLRGLGDRRAHYHQLITIHKITLFS